MVEVFILSIRNDDGAYFLRGTRSKSPFLFFLNVVKQFLSRTVLAVKYVNTNSLPERRKLIIKRRSKKHGEFS